MRRPWELKRTSPRVRQAFRPPGRPLDGDIPRRRTAAKVDPEEHGRESPCRGFGRLVARREKAPRRLPQIFEHMDEIEKQGKLDVAGLGLGLEVVQLRLIAVDEDDPRVLMARIAPVRFHHHLVNDVLHVVRNTRDQPFIGRFRPRRLSLARIRRFILENIARLAHYRGVLIDGPDFGHPFAAEFLSGREPRLQFVEGFRPFGRTRPERFGAHGNALAVRRKNQGVSVR